MPPESRLLQAEPFYALMVRALSRLADHQEPLAPHPATRPHRDRTGRGGGGAAKRRYKLRRMLGLVTRIKAIRRRTQTLFELNLELAKREAKNKATAAGIAGGLAAGGAVLAVYGIGFVFAAVAAGLSEALPLWLSLLIVGLVLFLLAAVALYFAKRSASRATPPQPTQAMDEAVRTVSTVKSHV